MALSAEGLGVGSSVDTGDALALAAFALARRFALGATLWCAAPEWREHARHVAVEFVHPVIVGKPALAAVSVDAPDLVSSLRALVGAGDVMLALGASGDPAIREVTRRADAWGAMSIWIGAGPRPGRGAADHVLWIDDDEGTAAHDGRLVYLYHVLWELTHVCLEHPGLLAAEAAACDPAGADVCVTCSDEGRVGEVVTVDGTTAHVRTATAVEVVDTTVVNPVRPGDLLLVHAGTAIAVMSDPAGAERDTVGR
jgi:hydrogenase maturation factor